MEKRRIVEEIKQHGILLLQMSLQLYEVDLWVCYNTAMSRALQIPGRYLQQNVCENGIVVYTALHVALTRCGPYCHIVKLSLECFNGKHNFREI